MFNCLEVEINLNKKHSMMHYSFIQKEPAATSVEPPSPVSSIPTNCTEDRCMNYGLQVMQLGVFLMQLNNTEAEGDGERSIRNWKVLMLYFRAQPRGLKYAFEAMCFLTFTKALCSERMAHRVLHGNNIIMRMISKWSMKCGMIKLC